MAQLTVMISGGFSGPYQQMLPQFEKMTGVTVTTLSGASQGSGPKTIKAQIDKGVSADVVSQGVLPAGYNEAARGRGAGRPGGRPVAPPRCPRRPMRR